jgi:thiol:disulfide interchange protein DsbC
MYCKALQATQEDQMSRFTLIPIRLAAAIAVMFAFAPAHASEDAAELEFVREKVSTMFDSIDPEDINVSPVDGWYTIHKGPIIAYVSADGRYLLQGDLIDLDDQANLSEAMRNESRKNLMATVSDDNVIRFTPEEIKYSVSVFTDVDCTYCRRLHSQIDEYLARGIEIRYLMYPRNGPASRAWNTAEEVWCAADRKNALTMAKLDRDFPTATCDASTIQNHYVIGRDVGLEGTPAIVFSDGTLISGYMSPDQLATALEKLKAE